MDQLTVDHLQQAWLVAQATAHPLALQLGCGMKAIPGAVNTDPNPDRWGYGEAAADAHALPFRDGTFGSVVSSHVINTFREPVRAFREMARVLRPGGYCCHVIPDWRYAPDRKSSHHRFERQSFGWLGPEPFRVEVMSRLTDVFQVEALDVFPDFQWSFFLIAVRLP